MSYGTVQAEKMTTESGYSLGAGNASSFKNRLINGGMAIDQRFAGTSTTNSDTYVTDRWYNQNSISGGTVTAQQSTDAPTGFSNSLIKTFTGVSYSGTSGYALVNQAVEKNNIIDLAYGTASAKTVTVSFWVKSSVTGNHSFALQNWASSRRSFLSSYTVNSANTWEFKSITIVGDTSFAPSNALNAVGISVRFCQGAGSQYTGSTADAWVTSDVFFLSGCVTPATTSGATWQITGCQLEVGTVATSFDQRPIGTELALCQRYCYVFASSTSQDVSLGLANGYGTTGLNLMVSVPVSMRSAPSIATSSGSWLYYAIGASSASTSVTPVLGDGSVTNPSTFRLFVSGISGITSGGNYWCIGLSSNSSKLTLSSEL